MARLLTNRIGIYTTILICFFAEVTIFDKLRIYGVRPELLLIATIFFGLYFGMVRGAEIGAISGILKDIFSLTDFGVNTFSFLLIGFLSGYLKNKLFKKNFITQFFISILSVYVISCIYFLYLSRIVKSDINAQFWKAFLYKGLYTGCIAPILFIILTKIFLRYEK